MIVPEYVELIFKAAVDLSQEGGFRNTIFVKDKEIFILNYDHTLLLRFQLREGESPFAHPIGFNANDYDSNEFQEVDGKIVFTSIKGNFQRKKTCGITSVTPDQVKELYRHYVRGFQGQEVTLNEKVIDLLDRDLSHVEFSGTKGDVLQLVQRNIYDGTVIEIRPRTDGLFSNPLDSDFGPIAIKTNDFAVLYSFDQKDLKFTFPSDGKNDYIVASSVHKSKRDMTAVIACCLYDEIIEIKESKSAS